jgi:hypothetical protein
MEVNDPPNRIRYREIVCTSVAGQIDFLSASRFAETQLQCCRQSTRILICVSESGRREIKQEQREQQWLLGRNFC